MVMMQLPNSALYSRCAVTLLQVKPHTGRTHQIRIHAQYAGLPLVGDPQYSHNDVSVSVSKDQQRVHRSLERQALHAASLVMPDEFSGEEEVYTAPLPADIWSAAKALGFSEDELRNL